MNSYKPVEAVLRGLEILAATGRLGPCRVRDLQAATGINSATIVRMLETLMHAGYVFQDEPRGRYATTNKVVALAAGHQAALELAHRSAPLLADLQDAVGWPSDVAVYDGEAMVTIANSPAEGRLSFNRPAGFRAAILTTSLGLAYIAFAAEPQRRAAIAAHMRALDAAIEPAVESARLARKLAAVRRLGYASMSPLEAMQTIGVPVIVDGVSIAALNIIFLRQAVPLRTAIPRFVPMARKAATAIARSMAG